MDMLMFYAVAANDIMGGCWQAVDPDRVWVGLCLTICCRRRDGMGMRYRDSTNSLDPSWCFTRSSQVLFIRLIMTSRRPNLHNRRPGLVVAWRRPIYKEAYCRGSRRFHACSNSHVTPKLKTRSEDCGQEAYVVGVELVYVQLIHLW